MGLGVSLFLIAIGAILAFAVDTTVEGLDIATVGWILMAVGAVGFLLSLVFWASWGGFSRPPRNRRRRAARGRLTGARSSRESIHAMSELNGKVVTRHRRGVGDRRGVRHSGFSMTAPVSSVSTSPDRIATSIWNPAVDGAAFAQLDVRDEDAIEAVVAAVVARARAARRGRHRGGRRRWWPGAPRRSRRMAARARHQPHRHVPRVQARDRADAASGHRRRRARLARHDRERRRTRRYGRRQLVQRVEGRGRDPHEEPRDRLRRSAASAANAICPGFIETPMLDGVFGMPGMEAVLADITHEHKLRRLGRPAEIASVAAFLARRDASFVTGQAIARRRWLHGRPRPRRDRAHGL